MVTIGSFDGVHIGHAALISRAREVASATSARVVALVFDPHPASTLRPGAEPPRLTTFGDRAARLLNAGVDEVVRLEPTRELLSRRASEFLGGISARYSVVAIVEGRDFRFGSGREGDVELMAREGPRLGFAAHVVDPVEIDLLDQSVVRASSTICRWLIGHGRVRDAAIVLGRPHQISGEVVRGDRRGRDLGFPTANIQVEQMAPGHGVYGARATLPDGRTLPAALSVGAKPQFGGMSTTVEAHLLDAPRQGDRIAGLPEYGWRLRLDVLTWIRDQAAFPSIGALCAQIERDCERARGSMERGALPAAAGADA